MTKSNIIKPERLALTEAQQNCVDTLSDALEEAMKGKITSLALVVCMNDGIGFTMAGTQGADLNIGLDQLKHNIRVEIFERGNIAKPQSSKIIKVQ